jgi:hypothetical protein
MSKFLIAFSTTLVLLPLQALAQNQYGFPVTETPAKDVPCHMVTSGGNTLDLARLCGGTPQVSQNVISQPVIAQAPPVTLEKFERVRVRMTLERVNQIMGFPGVQLTEESISRSATGRIKSVAYGWKNPDDSGVTAIFINDRVYSVSQKGLRQP